MQCLTFALGALAACFLHQVYKIDRAIKREIEMRTADRDLMRTMIAAIIETAERLDEIGIQADFIRNEVNEILKFLDTAKPGPTSQIVFYTSGHLIEGIEMQKVTETKSYDLKTKDAKGNASLVDGAPTWALTDPALATLVPAADGMSCDVVPSGTPGACKLQAFVDADMSPGVTPIMGEFDLQLIPGETVTVEISERV